MDGSRGYYGNTHQDSYDELERPHGPAVDRVCEGENQEDIEGG